MLTVGFDEQLYVATALFPVSGPMESGSLLVRSDGTSVLMPDVFDIADVVVQSGGEVDLNSGGALTDPTFEAGAYGYDDFGGEVSGGVIQSGGLLEADGAPFPTSRSAPAGR